MNVLIFTNLFPNPKQPLRGNFVGRLVKEMSKMAHITVVSPLPWFPEKGLLKFFTNGYNKLNYLSQYSDIPSYTQWNSIDVYYPRYPFIPVLSRPVHPVLMTIGVSNLVKKLVKERDIDIINTHWIYPDGIAATWIGKQIGRPVILSARGCDINLYGKYILRRPQIVWALKNSCKITTVSKALSQEIVNGLGMESKKIAVILNGVDRNKFNIHKHRKEVKEKLGLNKDKRYLIFIGQLHEVKGINYLIEALYILRNRGVLAFDTILIGDGELRDRVMKWIDEKELTEYITVRGNVSHDEVPLWMNACDILCLPSKREGLPNVILEALACGTPVVVSKVGGIPEVVNESNGILVEPRNPLALADALQFAFKKDWNRNMISKETENFSWKNSARLYIDEFEKVLQKKG
jgi:glycosyltransferase involved in cell wall biosynthesis